MANNQRPPGLRFEQQHRHRSGADSSSTRSTTPTPRAFGAFPDWLFKWEADEAGGVTGLDTLILSVNYLQGEIPDFEDDESIPVYTEAPDSLKDAAGECILVKNRIKRVMPQLRMLALNLNRMTGALPDWVLYHPALDWWDPFTLLFNQEGKDEQGNLAGFSNEPANMDYYYQAYPKKKLANMTDEDDAENGDDAGTTR